MLGEVPNTKDAAAGLVVSSGRDSAWAETIRAVYTKLRFTARHRDRGNVVLITSSLAGEGKSTLSANVAAAMAEAGQRTPWWTPTCGVHGWPHCWPSSPPWD